MSEPELADKSEDAVPDDIWDAVADHCDESRLVALVLNIGHHQLLQPHQHRRQGARGYQLRLSRLPGRRLTKIARSEQEVNLSVLPAAPPSRGRW
jgi:hypothetical protein